MRLGTTVSVKALAAACALALGLSACAGNDTDARDKFAYVERPVEALYQEAVDNMERRRFDEAILFFDEVERQHPYSSWARRAMLMSAFVKYEQAQYEDALADIERFLSIHPGNKDAPYAYYLRAMCHYERIRDVERDQDITRNALEALNDVMRRYPNTEYARDARLELDMTYDHLAGKEMEVGRFYLRRNQHVAAINRFNNVVDNFQTTSHTEEALHRLVEAYLELGVLPEAQRHAAILGFNYPGGEWYQDTYRLFRSRNLEDAFKASQEQRTAQADG